MVSSARARASSLGGEVEEGRAAIRGVRIAAHELVRHERIDDMCCGWRAEQASIREFTRARGSSEREDAERLQPVDR